MSEEQEKEFKTMTLPLIKWLRENHHPHMKIILTCTEAELVEGCISIVDDEYIDKKP